MVKEIREHMVRQVKVMEIGRRQIFHLKLETGVQDIKSQLEVQLYLMCLKETEII